MITCQKQSNLMPRDTQCGQRDVNFFSDRFFRPFLILRARPLGPVDLCVDEGGGRMVDSELVTGGDILRCPSSRRSHHGSAVTVIRDTRWISSPPLTRIYHFPRSL
jgi:hypothetical protein